jgi:hypothetical protein
MENAASIANRKPQELKPINEVNECGSNPFCIDPEKEFKDAQKSTMNDKVEGNGDAKKANKGYKKASTKGSKIVGEASEKVLGWNREDPDYMDKSHGTEIGDDTPFDGPEARNIDDGDKKITRSGEERQGTIHEEDTSMIYTPDNQNSPKPGVGPIGDDDPFDDGEGRQIDEAIDDLEGDADLEDDSLEGEEGFDDDGADEAEFELEVGDDEPMDDDLDDDLDIGGEDAVGGDLEDRMASIEDKLDQVLSALGDEQYEDDDLYDEDGLADDDVDDDDETEFDLEVGEDEPMDDEPMDDDLDDEEPIEDEIAFESRAYKAMKLRESLRRKALREGGMTPFRDAGRVPQGNMNKLDDFGKHPAYQKVVMSLPPKDLQEFPDYYDMNDESVRNDSPYGERIGDGAPFDIDPESIDNAIAESVRRNLKKKR